ncbi:hypothetical protein GWI33_002471 [Rhynchophorus ferrugineus]|uniref:Regulatory protein zeste n=1 Tax=Rhynchophorus ferrugineus TaxID=354439 RepID=A0A834IVL0_RHYFE|nr:hypothetical protein GWI33_002471 [Rhynchophorus ferrugineus]
MFRLQSFKPEEVGFLETLVEKHKDILNTKGRNHEMKRKRAECWIHIRDEFNSFSSMPRSIAMLKKKYDKIKTKKRILSGESLGSTKKTTNFKNNVLASVTIEPLSDMISYPSDFDDEDDFETSKLLKLVRVEIIPPPTPTIRKELEISRELVIPLTNLQLINEQTSSGNPDPNTSQANPQQTDNQEESIKIMREKHQMEIAIMKERSNNIIQRINKEIDYMETKIKQQRLKRSLLELQKKQLMKNLEIIQRL